MATTTLAFNNGNPFPVGPAGVQSAPRTLPATVSSVRVDLLDPSGDWVNPAKAGGTFIYGVQYSPDGGTTWNTLISNGAGQPVGSINHRTGALPSLAISRNTGLTEAYGMPCRAFASCSPLTITVAAQAVITT